MVTLGVNGWYKRSHDSSAAIVKNGKVIAFVEEERFSRYRHAFEQLPHRAIAHCLDKAGVSASQIDALAIGWDYLSKYRLHGLKSPLAQKDLIELYVPKKVFGPSSPELIVMEHHRAHAAAAFFPLNINEAAILVIDGQGEKSAISFWIGRHGELIKVREFSIALSPGYFYESANRILGFDYLDSGKTMGLASYGKKRLPFNTFQYLRESVHTPFDKRFQLSKTILDEQLEITSSWHRYFARMGIRISSGSYFADKNKMFTQSEKNFAYGVQMELEDLVLWLARELQKETRCETICLAGGVALNCNANSALKKSGIFQNVSVLPMVNDAGVSLGAALEVQNKYSKDKKISWSPYSGPEYSNNEILQSIKKYSLPFLKTADPEKNAARALSKGQIIGWFQGRMEAGPRALGNRSILANPSIPGINDMVNAIKGRENWRPLAPSILEEKGSEILERFFPSPYMLHTFIIKKHKRGVLPGICHVDNTCRPQSVNKKQNHKYYNLIKEFDRLTGIPLVLNTSFNGPSEPIVCGPDEAIRMFLRSKLDALVIGNYVIARN